MTRQEKIIQTQINRKSMKQIVSMLIAKNRLTNRKMTSKHTKEKTKDRLKKGLNFFKSSNRHLVVTHSSMALIKISNFQRKYILSSIISVAQTNRWKNLNFKTSFYFSQSKVNLNSQKRAHLNILILSRSFFRGSIAGRIL